MSNIFKKMFGRPMMLVSRTRGHYHDTKKNFSTLKSNFKETFIPMNNVSKWSALAGIFGVPIAIGSLYIERSSSRRRDKVMIERAICFPNVSTYSTSKRAEFDGIKKETIVTIENLGDLPLKIRDMYYLKQKNVKKWRIIANSILLSLPLLNKFQFCDDRCTAPEKMLQQIWLENKKDLNPLTNISGREKLSPSAIKGNYKEALIWTDNEEGEKIREEIFDDFKNISIVVVFENPVGGWVRCWFYTWEIA